MPASGVFPVMIVRHVPSQKSAVPIHLAVVQPILWLVGFGIADMLDLLCLEIIEIEAIGQRQHGAAFRT